MSFYEPKPNGTYDQALLASAPIATRAEKQEGYNVDLLDENRGTNASSSPHDDGAVSDPEQVRFTDTPAGYARPRTPPSLTLGTRPPWYRRPVGIIAIVAGILIIIGAIIGGAVGGTRKHHSSNDTATNGQDGLPQGQSQAQGPASSSLQQQPITSAPSLGAVSDIPLSSPTPTPQAVNLPFSEDPPVETPTAERPPASTQTSVGVPI